MIHNNVINGYQYRKYRAKTNNKIAKLPNIFIKGGQMVMGKDKDKNKKDINDIIKKSDSSTQSTEDNKKSQVFKILREETIHFGDTIKDDSEFISKDKSKMSKISKLPKLTNPEEKKEVINVSSHNWMSENGDNQNNIVNNEENKEENKEDNKEENKISNKKSSTKKENSQNKTKEENKESENKEKSDKNEEEEKEGEEEDDEDDEESDEDSEESEEKEKSDEKGKTKNEEEEKDEDDEEEEKEEDEEEDEG